MSETASSFLPTSNGNVSERIHLDHLDGIRGFAALYVVAFHIWLATLKTSDGSIGLFQMSFITNLLSQGPIAVEIFIVLSGYCLMLPVLRSKSQKLPHGFYDYIKRRARRILPPYYFALVFSIALFIYVPGLLNFVCGKTSIVQIWPTIVAHLLMLHNLDDKWAIGSVNGSMWSVATEWQIYFLFPLLLLPLWRRFGIAIPIIVGLLLGNLTEHQHLLSLDYAKYWYIGLFATGMAAAVVSFPSVTDNITPHSDDKPCLRTPPKIWETTTILLVCGHTALDYLNRTIEGHFRGHLVWICAALTGLATGSFLIWCACFLSQGKRKPIFLKILSSKPAVWLGVFSYSLYLTHDPLLQLFMFGLSHFRLTHSQTFFCLMGLGFPLMIIFAYFFHLAFERRFMRMPPIIIRSIRQRA